MNKKGVALVLGAAIISGISIFLNKFAVTGIDSSIFTFSKNIVVAVILVSALLLWKRNAFSSLSRKNWVQLALIGFVGGSIPFLLFFRGLQLSSGAMGSFLHKTMFIVVAVLALIFLKEKIRKEFLIAGMALLAGNFLLLRMNGFSIGMGEVLVIAATGFWAAENIISKHALKDLDGTTVAAGRMGFGAFFIFLFLLASGKSSLLLSVSGDQLLWILFTSALLVAYLMAWYNGLKHVDVSVATAILLIGSPITSLLSFAFLSASFNLSDAAGMIFIAAGVLLVMFGRGLSDVVRHRFLFRG